MDDKKWFVVKASGCFVVMFVAAIILEPIVFKKTSEKVTKVSCVNKNDTGYIKVLVILCKTPSFPREDGLYHVDYDHKKPICLGDSMPFVQLQSSNLAIWAPAEKYADTADNVFRWGVVTEIQKIR